MPRPKGNGPGHGGPATGPGWGGPPKGEGNKGPGPGRGHTHRSVAELMAAQNAREIAAQRWLEILNDPTHPHHATMVVKAAERLDGAPKQEIEATVASHVVRAPVKPANVDEWAATYAPNASK